MESHALSRLSWEEHAVNWNWGDYGEANLQLFEVFFAGTKARAGFVHPLETFLKMYSGVFWTEQRRPLTR